MYISAPEEKSSAAEFLLTYEHVPDLIPGQIQAKYLPMIRNLIAHNHKIHLELYSKEEKDKKPFGRQVSPCLCSLLDVSQICA